MKKKQLLRITFLTTLAASTVFSYGFKSLPFHDSFSYVSSVEAADASIKSKFSNDTVYKVLKILVNASLDGVDVYSKVNGDTTNIITNAQFKQYLDGAELTDGSIILYEGEVNLKPYNLTNADLKGLNLASNVKKVTLPKTVTEIQDSTFQKMTSLQTVIMSKGVTKIGVNAFEACSALETINVYADNGAVTTKAGCLDLSNVTYIGNSAFMGCKSFSSLNLNNNIGTLDSNSFKNCTKFSGTVKIPKGVKLGTGVFSGCTNLSRIEFAKEITEVPNTFLTDISGGLEVFFESGSNLTKIGNSAFRQTIIKSINIENTAGSLKVIDKSAFEKAAIASDFKFGSLNKLTNIGMAAFFCTTFYNTAVTLPTNLTDLGTASFAGSNISSISIPAGVGVINNGTFCFAYNLSSVSFANNNIVQKIGDYAFAFDGNLTSTSFLSNTKITSVGDYAFANCNTFTNKLEFDEAGYITGLEKVTLPSTVTSIGEYCFYNSCGIKQVSDLGNVKKISPYAFAVENTTNFPTWASSGVKFEAEDSSGVTVNLTFPKAMQEAYRTDTYISELAQPIKVTLPTGVTVIDKGAFEYRERLSGINATGGHVKLDGLSNLSEIGNYAFKNCGYFTAADINAEKLDGIKQVTFPAKLAKIGEQAFYQDYNLSTVNFASGSSLKEISKEAFAYCTPSNIKVKCGLSTLTNFNQQKNLETIGNSAFRDNPYLQLDKSASPFLFPVSVKVIDDMAFYNCKYTNEIKFQQNLETIGSYAFSIALDQEDDTKYGLESVDFKIATGLKNLGTSAFAYNQKLKVVEMVNTKIDKVSSNAFAGCESLEDFKGPDATLKAIEGYSFSECPKLDSITFPVDSTINGLTFGNEPVKIPKLNINLGNLSKLMVPFGQKISFEANAFTCANSLSFQRDNIDITNGDPEDYFTIEYSGNKFFIKGGANAKANGAYAQIVGTFVFGSSNAKTVTASIDIPVNVVGVRAKNVIMKKDKQSDIQLDVDNANNEVAANVTWSNSKTSNNSPKYVGYVNASRIPSNPDDDFLITLQADIDPSTFTYGIDGQKNNLRWEVASGANVLEIYDDAVNTTPKDYYSSATQMDEDSYFTTVQKVKVKSKGEAVLRLVYSYKEYNNTTKKWDEKFDSINLIKVKVVNPISYFTYKLKETDKPTNIELIQGNTANILIDSSSFTYLDPESKSSNEPKDLVYYSDNPNVATVNNSGVVVAQKIYDNGYYEKNQINSCTIYVRTHTGATGGAFYVTVREEKSKVAPNYLEMNGDDYLNLGGKSKNYTTTNFPALSNENVEWTLNGGAAKLTVNGNTATLTPVRVGTVYLTAVSKDFQHVSISKQINIVRPTKNIKFIKKSTSIEEDSWYYIGFVADTNVEEGMYRPKENEDYVTYTVADPSIAKISNQQIDSTLSNKVVINTGSLCIKGIKEGKTTITATTESGGKDVFTIVIAKKTIKTLSVKESASINVGATFKLSVTKKPSDSLEGYTFSSSNTAVATVDAKGNVKGVKEGVAEIYVVTDINKVRAVCTVTVTPRPASWMGDAKPGQKVTVKGVNYVGNKDGSVTLKSSPTAKNTLSIPATVTVNGQPAKVTAIAPNAFKNNKKIKVVNIGANVKTIGAGSFQNCTALTTVKMGKKVTSIGNNAFSGCKKLKTVTIGANVTSIGNNAFKNCKALTKIVIPAKVKTIGSSAFAGCSKLGTITIKTKKLTKVGAKAFKTVKKGAIFKCPSAKLDDYTKLLNKSGLPAKRKITK